MKKLIAAGAAGIALAFQIGSLRPSPQGNAPGPQGRIQDRRAGAAHRQPRGAGQAPPRGLRDHARPHQQPLRRRDGQKLVFVVGDAPDPTAAASEATRLATREGVKIITGTFSSTLCGAASEAAARQNVIYWETSCVDPRFTRRGLKNVFRTEIDGTGFGWYNVEFIAKYLAPRLGKKPNELRIAYLSEDSSYGQGVTEAARERAKKEFGMQEVALEYYTFTTNDLTPVILKLKSATRTSCTTSRATRTRSSSGARRASRTSRSRRSCTPAPPATATPASARRSATTPTGLSRCSEPGAGLPRRQAAARGPEDRARLPRGGEGQDRLGRPHRRPPARRRRPVAAQARARRRQDRRPRQVPRRGDVDGPAGRQPDQRLGREVRRDRARTPTSACSTTCCSGRTASSSPCGRRSSPPTAAKWMPLGPWDQRK